MAGGRRISGVALGVGAGMGNALLSHRGVGEGGGGATTAAAFAFQGGARTPQAVQAAQTSERALAAPAAQAAPPRLPEVSSCSRGAALGRGASAQCWAGGEEAAFPRPCLGGAAWHSQKYQGLHR